MSSPVHCHCHRHCINSGFIAQVLVLVLVHDIHMDMDMDMDMDIMRPFWGGDGAGLQHQYAVTVHQRARLEQIQMQVKL